MLLRQNSQDGLAVGLKEEEALNLKPILENITYQVSGSVASKVPFNMIVLRAYDCHVCQKTSGALEFFLGNSPFSIF